MTDLCLVPARVIRNPSLARSLFAAAYTTVLIAGLAGAAAGQRTGTKTSAERFADSPLGASGSVLSATPVISGPLIFLPQVISSLGGTFETGRIPAAIGDLNGDGKLDLAVLEDATTVSVLLGNGDGSFQAPQTYASGLESDSGITIADLNGDGKLDLVVTGCSASCSPGDVAVLLGNGDGSFKPGVLYSSGGYVGDSVAVADVNRDGKADLVVENACSTTQCTGYGSVGVLLGNGDGTFKPVVTYSTGGSVSFGLAIADVNGDGDPDLLVANGCNIHGCTTYDQSHQVSVLLGKGDGTFRPAVGYASGGTARIRSLRSI
jgi:hypothetical protein